MLQYSTAHILGIEFVCVCFELDDSSTELSATAERALGLLTSYAKEHAVNVIVIGQVTKDGKMAGSDKLKHMVDSYIHLSVETKDDDLSGCRVLETQKNRFGGAGHVIFLRLRKNGFSEVARISDSGV